MNKQELLLSSPIPVSVNHYLKVRVVKRGNKHIPIMYETEEAKEYKRWFSEYVREEVGRQNWIKNSDKTQHYYMDCVFYFDRIDKDPNNYFKLLCDAVTKSGMVWLDDNVVCERVQGIYYDSENPRIEIKIFPVDYVGIFNNYDEMKLFEEKCQCCRRYLRNCSILRDCKTGKIRKEVKNKQCREYKE